MKFTIVANPSAEDVRPYENLRNTRSADYFIAESEKIVTRLLRSKLEILSLYLTEDHLRPMEELLALHHQQRECKVLIGSRKDMEKIVGFSLHQRMLAAATIPSETSLDQLLKQARRPLLFIILDEVADAENMGSIIRTSFALDCTAVIIDKKSVSPWMRRAVRVSMGAVFELPVLTMESIPHTIRQLHDRGVITFAATLNDSAEIIWNCDFSGDSAIVFGSEGHGIKADIIDACHKETLIPMQDSLHSLNVGSAQSIFLYEVMRQRANKVFLKTEE